MRNTISKLVCDYIPAILLLRPSMLYSFIILLMTGTYCKLGLFLSSSSRLPEVPRLWAHIDSLGGDGIVPLSMTMGHEPTRTQLNKELSSTREGSSWGRHPTTYQKPALSITLKFVAVVGDRLMQGIQGFGQRLGLHGQNRMSPPRTAPIVATTWHLIQTCILKHPIAHPIYELLVARV